jgi:hypothetical protein
MGSDRSTVQSHQIASRSFTLLPADDERRRSPHDALYYADPIGCV